MLNVARANVLGGLPAMRKLGLLQSNDRQLDRCEHEYTNYFERIAGHIYIQPGLDPVQ